MSLYSTFRGTKTELKVAVGQYPSPLCKYKQNFNAGYAVDKKGEKHKIIFY